MLHDSVCNFCICALYSAATCKCIASRIWTFFSIRNACDTRNFLYLKTKYDAKCGTNNRKKNEHLAPPMHPLFINKSEIS